MQLMDTIFNNQFYQLFCIDGQILLLHASIFPILANFYF